MNTFGTSAKGVSILLFFSFFSTTFLFAQLPSGFVDSKVQGDYTSPMGLIFSKNGQKMFVWEKAGLLWVSTWNGSTYVKQSTPTLDIREEVGNWRDMGLESVALDPNFDSNGLVYLFYQVDRHHLLNFGTPQYSSSSDAYFNASISRLTRYKLNTNGSTLTTDYSSRKILLGETKSTGVPLVHESHAGGQIIFGADGSLFVTTGDNASYASSDMGSASETYWAQAVADGIMRSTENVGSFRAQLINSFCGKLLRMDPNTGDGIPSNPYYDAANSRSAKSRVWALGLRNPYRMCFKTGTGSTNRTDGNPGTLIVGDVQNGTWEEVHIIEKAGVNCGWPLYEGITPQYQYYDSNKTNDEEAGSPTFASLCVRGGRANINNPIPSQRRYAHAAPALDWKHRENIARYPDYNQGNTEDPLTIGTAGALVAGTPFNGTCVTAGTYYTGTAFPSHYRNVFFFSDYNTNWIKALSIHDNDTHQVHEVIDFAPENYGKGVVDLEYCPLDESLFYVNINTGDIQKISFGSSNRPPVAVIAADRLSGTSPLTVNFNSTGSNDPDGTITYSWNFGDGSPNSTQANPSHTFVSSGAKAFTVTLTVKDNNGLTDSKSLTISTNNTPPSVKITNPTNNSKYSLTSASQVNLKSTVTDNDPTGLQYAWQVTLRHNTHEHRDPIVNQANPTVQISPVGCDGETYYYLIEVTVTDNGGLKARDSVKIYPDCASGNLSVANIKATPQNNAIAVNWTNPVIGFDEIMVVAREGLGFLTNPNGTNYTANANFVGNGSAFENGKVVYRGIGTNVTVTSLTTNKRYYFRVFTRKGTNWTGGVETSAVPIGTTSGGGQLGCLKASYFNNKNLTGIPTAVRPESSIDNTWLHGGPSVTGIGVDNFSVRWEGYVVPPTTGNYTFTVQCDDGARLWVNNVKVIDKWFSQSSTTYTAVVKLTEGQNIPIKLEYYEGGGRAVAQLFWTVPNQSSQIIRFSPCPITTTPSASNFDPNKCYKLTNHQNGKVLEIPNNALTNGASVQQRTYTAGSKNQLWKLKENSDGTYRIVNANSGKVMDINNASTALGANVIQWDWTSGSNQRFSFNKNAEGTYKIVAKHSNLPIEPKNSNTNDGTQIWQYTATGSYAQLFKVEEASCPSGVVASESVNILMADGYREARKAVITWVSNANDNSDYFMVQKLNSNEPVFEKMTLVNASPNSQQLYTVVDDNPTDGENIYRVVLFRQNAVLPQYSELIALDFSDLGEYRLFPNPSDDYVDIDLEPVRYRSVHIRLIDASGKIVQEKKIDSVPIAPVRFDLNGLDIGQYFIHIEAQGKREIVKKLMIVR